MPLDFFHYPDYSGLNATNNPYDGIHTLDDFDQHDKSGMLFPDHLGHCIDTLRQALMCYADTTPYVWQYDSKSDRINLYQETMHMCVDFNAIREWARERRYDGMEYETDFEFETSYKQDVVGRCGYEEDCGVDGLPGDQEEEREWRSENRWVDSEMWWEMRGWEEREGNGEWMKGGRHLNSHTHGEQ